MKGDHLRMENESRAQTGESHRDPASGDSAVASAADLELSKQLLEEATREWHALAESLVSLRKSLDPDDFGAALSHLKIPGIETLIRDWRKAQAHYTRTLAAESTRREDVLAPTAEGTPVPEKRAADRSEATRETTPGKTTRPTRELSSEPGPDLTQRSTGDSAEPQDADRTQEPPEGTREPPEGTSEIQKQLADLASLLRQHVVATTEHGASSTVEVPRQLTLSIAREVAGRVKDSVLETLRANGLENAADRKAQAKSKRIPLEDVAAMIDQLTKL